MPIYEYTCPDCGHDFEVLQKFSDDPVKTCPTCNADNVRKRISLASFALKGDGWYKDHYGLKKGGGDAPAAKAEPATPSAPAAPAAAPATPAAPSSPAPAK
ncbi:MAG: FmdB family zinc ribbon protein [Myxococcota bacterium]